MYSIQARSTIVAKSLRPPSIFFLTKASKNLNSMKIRGITHLNASDSLGIYFPLISISAALWYGHLSN